MRLFLIILSLIILTLNCSGQIRTDIGSTIAKINQNDFNQGTKIINEDQIGGSPYLDKEFKSALIIKTDHTEIKDIFLRYNILKNTMEFKQKETVLFIADPVTISRIIFDNTIFVYCLYKDSKKVRLSYFQLITEGKYQLLKKYNTVFRASDGKTDTPARFENIQPDYYLRYRDGMAHKIRSRKELIKLIQPISQEVIDYLQQKRINIQNEEELTTAILYINNSVN